MIKKKLSVEEALALAQRRRHQWVLLGFELSGPDVCARPTFACPQCWRQHVTLVTPKAKLPAGCPRCKAPLSEPEASLAHSAGVN